MKFSVGFQLYEENDEPFSDIVKDFKDCICEVLLDTSEYSYGEKL